MNHKFRRAEIFAAYLVLGGSIVSAFADAARGRWGWLVVDLVIVSAWVAVIRPVSWRIERLAWLLLFGLFGIKTLFKYDDSFFNQVFAAFMFFMAGVETAAYATGIAADPLIRKENHRS